MKTSTLRQLVPIFIFVILTVVLGTFLFYKSEQESQRQNTENELQTIMALKVGQIEQWRANKLAVARVLNENLLVKEALLSYLKQQDPQTKEKIQQYLGSLQQNYNFSNVMVVNAKGKVHLSLNGQTQYEKGQLELVGEVLRSGNPLITDIYLDPLLLKPTIDILVPMHVQGAGYVITLQVDVRKELYPLINYWPTHSETAETVLVRRDGDNVLYLNDLRHEADAALKKRIPLSNKESTAAMAVLGAEGFVSGRDYRNESVLTVLKKVPNSPWFMVTKIDTAEVYANWHSKAVLILSVAGLLIMIAFTFIGMIWQRNEVSHYKALAQTQAALKRIEWMLTPKDHSEKQLSQSNGNRVEINPGYLIQNSVGPKVLNDIANDFMDLLGTSFTVFEQNGDYAYSTLTSKWCHLLDGSSRQLCGADTLTEAAQSGQWLCHESCWTHTCKVAVEAELAVDNVCFGGIHLYAVPVWAQGRVVGSVCMGYGDPPHELRQLQQIASSYQVDLIVLQEASGAYETRPAFIIELAKDRLHSAARLMGAMVERMAQLESSNKELESFAYSVSHDLRSPLRAIDGFSRIVMEDYADKIDAEGQRLLHVVRANTQKMDRLITDLLALSRVTRTGLNKSKIAMNVLVESVYREIALPSDDNVEFTVEELPDVYADPALLHQVWLNLLGNALKYTRTREKRVIHVGGSTVKGLHMFFVKDNGVGFNPHYTHKLFGIFQRLHKADEFEGTGIGLAIVQRVILRHEGKAWAEGQLHEGATFYFTLPDKGEFGNERD